MTQKMYSKEYQTLEYEIDRMVNEGGVGGRIDDHALNGNQNYTASPSETNVVEKIKKM